MTHMLNTVTLLVPDNENYYIRHLSEYSDDLSYPRLKTALQQYCRQEAQHGIGHKACWPNFDRLGQKYRGFVKAIGWFIYKVAPASIVACSSSCLYRLYRAYQRLYR